MPRLLLINPNTTEAVTRVMAERALALAPPGGELNAVTARFGAAYIVDERSAAVAAHAVLDAADADAARPDAASAVLIGCFGDPGLLALREPGQRPVTGLAEASMRAAAVHGRFAIVTGGARWRPMLERLAWSLDLLAPLAGIVTVQANGAELAADPPAALRLLEAACQEALRLPDVQCIVVGGAALAGMAAALQPRVPLPLIDSVDAGIHAAWALAGGAAVAQVLRTSP